jgi:ribonuclease-3
MDIANVVEAIFGALYKYKGMDQSEHLFNQIIDQLNQLTTAYHSAEIVYNPISLLQEYCQKHGSPLPIYTLLEKRGADHNPLFVYQVQIQINDQPLEEIGKGKSKKQARANAASNIISKLT